MGVHPEATVRRIWYSAYQDRNEAVTSRETEYRYDSGSPIGAKMMRLFLAATIASGLTLTPAALAKDAAKPAASKHKTHRTAKAGKTNRNVSGPASQTNTNSHPYGEPYTMQKDEMTR
jgi:hypothetical protein